MTIERAAEVIKQHIKVDATGLAPAVVSHYIFGFEAAAQALSDAGLLAGGWRPVNMNDKVGVRLTPHGHTCLRNEHDRLFANLPSPPVYERPKEDGDGWSEFQLWDLMHRLGAHYYLGCQMPFETTIRLPPPPPSDPAIFETP